MLKGKTQKELLQLSKQIVQPLLPTFHKGQAGKIAVIGGSEDYTGAPFFSCHSAALIGSDMNHIVCEKLAAPVIKLYSPDLMVHPYLYQLTNPEIASILTDAEIDEMLKLSPDDLLKQKNPKLNGIIDDKVMPKVTLLLNRIDLVIIGPGFGRDPLMMKSLIRIIEELRVLNKPMILDADSLFLLSLKPLLIQNYSNAIITPNVVEFDRLAKAFNIKNSISETDLEKLLKATTELSKKLGDVVIVRKGAQDLIVKLDQYLVSDLAGSWKRVGGQGDTLTGTLAAMVNWSNNYDTDLWEIKDKKFSPEESTLLACFAASAIVKMSSLKAFKKYGRSMQTSNLHEFLNESYNDVYETGDFVKLLKL
ncbi:uncharacterized protein PRCAT00002293001 [Priceomyces carsonii]|uniref:uncharacterized protein n=1 Tax=Priceomyces carsonii TaxID=28549 RepID=UPI002ED9D082|nr:unnamed protein product [Priceomyces carsonii]